jgi:hypothetical protein
MAAQSPDLKKVVEMLSSVGRQVSQSAAVLGKLEIDWKKVPTAHGPLGLADAACTQDNQCEPNPSCHINNGC